MGMKKLKQILLPFVLLALAAVLFFASCRQKGSETIAGDPWEVVLQRGHGKLAAYYVPAGGFAYMCDEGMLTGVTVDILKDFSQFVMDAYGVELEIRFMEEADWSIFYRKIAEGKDGMIGMGNVTITGERMQELTFSPPYMTNIASLITHEDAPRLQRLNELGDTFEGRKALAFEGTLHENRLRTLTGSFYPDAEIKMAHTNDEILERVAESDRYFAYIDLYNYRRASDRGMPLQRHPVADEAAEQFGYIMPLETTWDGVIKEYFKHDGGLLNSQRYRYIMETHLGKELASLLL